MRTTKIIIAPHSLPATIKHLIKPGTWIELPADLPTDQADARINKLRNKLNEKAYGKIKDDVALIETE